MFEMEGRMFGGYFGGLPHFILYFVVASALLAIFVTVYIRLTAHDEVALIREGNLAAALALGGSMVGFVLPLSKSVAQATSIPDMLIWGLAAFIVQILAYLVARPFAEDRGGAFRHRAFGRDGGHHRRASQCRLNERLGRSA